MNQARALFNIATYNTSNISTRTSASPRERGPDLSAVLEVPSGILILLKAHSFGRRIKFLVDTASIM